MAAGALSAALGATAVCAAPRSESVVEIRVSYADLNLAAPAGAHVLMQRIARAAATVCGGGPDSRLYDDRIRFERCRADAVGRAVKQLDPAIVSAGAANLPGTIIVAIR